MKNFNRSIILSLVILLFTGTASPIPRWVHIVGGAGLCGVSSVVSYKVAKKANLLEAELQALENSSLNQDQVKDLKSQIKKSILIKNLALGAAVVSGGYAVVHTGLAIRDYLRSDETPDEEASDSDGEKEKLPDLSPDKIKQLVAVQKEFDKRIEIADMGRYILTLSFDELSGGVSGKETLVVLEVLDKGESRVIADEIFYFRGEYAKHFRLGNDRTWHFLSGLSQRVFREIASEKGLIDDWDGLLDAAIKAGNKTEISYETSKKKRKPSIRFRSDDSIVEFDGRRAPRDIRRRKQNKKHVERD